MTQAPVAAHADHGGHAPEDDREAVHIAGDAALLRAVEEGGHDARQRRRDI